MENRIWVLGAPDPEMELIERVLRECGERIEYATVWRDGVRRRVTPAEAYAPDVEIGAGLRGLRATAYMAECAPAVLVGSAIDGIDWAGEAITIDHHRPGDPGFGKSPAEFLSAASIGQVIAELAIQRTWREETAEGSVYFPSETPIERAGWRTLPGGSHHDHDSTWGIDEIGEYTEDAYGGSGEAVVKEMVDEGGYYHVPHIGWVFVASRGGHELGGCVDAIVIPDRFVLAAAADHCLGAAYRGECPGVDPDALMRWRVESRARFQGRSVDDLLADVERAREALRAATTLRGTEDVYLGPGGTCHDGHSEHRYRCRACGASWQDCCGPIGHECDLGLVRDLRGPMIPELPDAASREGLAYLAEVAVDGSGRPCRPKIVLGGCTTPEMVEAFMREWAPAHGLVDIYGDPARGFAGGYRS